jgi:hypothetical protein
VCKLLAIVLILGSFSALGQDISKKYPELITRVKQINTGNYHVIVTLKNEEFMPHMTDGGGKLTGYYNRNKIEKISREIVLSYGIETLDYYFTAGQLIFIYETLRGFRYNEDSGTFDYTKTNTNFNFIGRYYFRENKLIDLETTGHNRFEDDSIDIEATLLKEMKDFQRQLDRKRSNNAR